MNISENQIATALIAKLAGSALLDIDNKTVVQSSGGPAAKIDPKQFLVPKTTSQLIDHNQRMVAIEEANRLAEQLYPLPSQPTIPQQPQSQTVEQEDPNQLLFDFGDNDNKISQSEAITLLRDIKSIVTEIVNILRKNSEPKNRSK